MGPERSIDCPDCGLRLPCPRWGCFYVTNEEGRRVVLEGDLESTIIAGTLGIDEQAITGCVCGSGDVKTFVQLIGAACPRCGTGTLEER